MNNQISKTLGALEAFEFVGNADAVSEPTMAILASLCRSLITKGETGRYTPHALRCILSRRMNVICDREDLSVEQKATLIRKLTSLMNAM